MTEPLDPFSPRGESLTDDLVAISHWADPVVVPDIELLDAHEVQGEPPAAGFPWQRALLAAAAVVLLIAGVWVLSHRDRREPVAPTPGEAAWVETAPSPLQPRNQAQAVWTGSEFIVFAGTSQPECPLCDDAQHGPTLHDAAAYDPRADSWRTIAPLPDDASYVGQAAFAGGDVYWFSVRDPDTNANGIDATLYRYRVQADQWVSVPLPAEVPNAPKLTAAGDAILLYPSTDEAGSFNDWLWSETGSDRGFPSEPQTWTPLPDDPFPQSFDRQYLDGGDSFLLFSRSTATAGRPESAPIVHGASLFSGQWAVTPDSDQLVPPFVTDSGAAWAPVGGGIVASATPFGQDIPNGGVFDLAKRGWASLPGTVPDDLNGMIGRTTSFIGAARGTVLDTASGRYVPIPTLPDSIGDGYGQALTAFGSGFFSFGGTTGGFIAPDGPASPSPLGVHNRAFVWRTTPLTGSASADIAALEAALTALGIDKGDAPDGTFDLAGGRFCGYEEVSFIGGTPNTDGRACFRAALDGDTNAIFITQGQTTEGDPVAQVWRTVDGVDHVYSDGTRDKFGSGGWTEQQCTLVATGGSQPFACEEDGLIPATDPPTASTDTTPTPVTTGDKELARWDLVATPQPGDTELHITVTRISCASGETEPVLPTDVVEDDSSITITAWVASLTDGGRCPTNNAVAVTLPLRQPVGDRTIVDGGCALNGLTTNGPGCIGSGVRWPPRVATTSSTDSSNAPMTGPSSPTSGA